MTPQMTLELLDRLEKLGFDDDAFWRLHHFRLKGERDTISRHRKYCAKISVFRGVTNQLVQKRLEYVLARFSEGEPVSFRKQRMVALAEDAFREIPPR